MITQLNWKIISPVWIFPEQFITRTILFLKICSPKSPLLCLFASTIKIVPTSSERPLPTAPSYFTQGNWFWKWFWKTMGEVDLDFKQSIRLRKSISPSLLPSRNRFSKAPSASSMLILSRESKFVLHFSSVRGRVTAIFKSNLTTWKEKLFEKIHLQKLWRTAFVPQRGDVCERPRRVVHRLLRDDALRQAPCSQDRQPIDRA